MAILPIRQLGDEVLRQLAQPVRKINAEVKTLIEDMFDTMHAAGGIGLAAPQVGVSKRIIVVHVPHELPMAFVNPCLGEWSGQVVEEEGCLSIPGVVKAVPRHQHINIGYKKKSGRWGIKFCSGLLARVIQHEIDHLDGKLIIDYEAGQ